MNLYLSDTNTMQALLFNETEAAESSLEGMEIGGRTPRPYQVQGVGKAMEQFNSGSLGTLLRSPTGTGKSFMLAMTADEWLKMGPDRRVLVLLHDVTLIHQLAPDLMDTLGIAVGIEQRDHHIDMESPFHPRIIVGSRASLSQKENGDSRLHKFDHSKYQWLVVFDECHRWRWNLKSCKHICEWFAENPENRRLGLSATPERGDKAKFDKLFPSVCLDYKFSEAVADGWIVPYRQRWIDVKDVIIEDMGSLKSQMKLDQRFDKLLQEKKILDGLIKPAIQEAGDRQTIVFTPNVDSAYAVAAAINDELGWDAARAIHGETKKEKRQYVFGQHQKGAFQFLCVCGLCREGYDDPNVSCVVILRPTRSRGLAEQMKGRGCRVLKGTVDGLETAEERREAIAASDKSDCLIVDMAGITGLRNVPSTVEILAEGKPDDVIERAKRKTEKGEEDPAKAIEEAEQEIEKEREERARREAQRRAAIRTRVEYDAHDVESGHGGSYNRRARKGKGGATKGQVDYLVKLGINRETAESFTKPQAGKVISERKELSGGKYRIAFGKHAGKSLAECPENFCNWILTANAADPSAFADVVPHIKQMQEQPDLYPVDTNRRRTQQTTQQRATDGQIRLAQRFNLPIPSSYEEGVSVVQQVNSMRS